MADQDRVLSRRGFLTLGTAPASRSLPQDGPRKARIALECLALKGIVCRTCGEHCEPRAIHYQLLPAGRSFPRIDEDCNGCGACVPVCPVRAVALVSPDEALA
jgi:formate hydrogenlyase subunit 6/NADH:ubiquinone oxidoreductase subunit I